jgi:hypothetical protein
MKKIYKIKSILQYFMIYFINIKIQYPYSAFIHNLFLYIMRLIEISILMKFIKKLYF